MEKGEKETVRYYGAYGSNLNIEQMEYRCPEAKLAGVAWLPDYALLFKGSQSGNYLTVEPKAESQVPLGIWEVSADDEISLDFYEGFPSFYTKEELTLPVIKTDGKTELLPVFFYVMDPGRKKGLPFEPYLETCLQGYADFSFDTHYLEEALKNSWE